ncbi:DUF917-domain-containing protein [Hyaloraphidium curvatum]|nr:DUF917-domain-containing protein [Hyaloraphidium curvatum]
MSLRIGVDVGGTNTDAVLIDAAAPAESRVLATFKAPTSADVLSGLCAAISRVLASADPAIIESVSIGTTAFLNAVVERSGRLTRTVVLRLCGPATRSMPPFADWPEDLAAVVADEVFYADGGYEVDGRPIREVDQSEIRRIASLLANQTSVAVCGVCSTIRSDQEKLVRDILLETNPTLQVTISCDIAPQIGFLERENATILNASLVPLARRTVSAIMDAMKPLGLSNTPLFLTTNDGTVVSASDAAARPINCIRSGPTNSMRGAAFLAGLTEPGKGGESYVVVDIGGTTTDVGVIEKNGLVRPAASTITIGGVRSNFVCSDVVSCALGGGSIVRALEGGQVSVGPDSVGYEITSKAKVFGGHVLTTTDVAVASGLASLGDPSAVSDLAASTVAGASARIRTILETEIDRVKTSPDDVPCLLVGGGAILVPESPLRGVSRSVKPPHAGFANAVGAAIAKVAGAVDVVADLTKKSEQEALDEAKKQATRICVDAGADPDAVEVVVVESVPLAYLPSTSTRIVVKAVGERAKSGRKTANGGLAKAGAANGHANGRPGEASVLSGAAAPEPSPRPASAPAAQSPTAAGLPASDTKYVPLIRDGVWHLTPTDVVFLEEGCGFLGCGGGGSPYKAAVRARNLLKGGKQIRVVDAGAVGADEYVYNVGFMGSPVASAEKVSNGLETVAVLDAISKDSKREGRKIMVTEIGGGNGIVPLLCAAESDGFVVDADGMGRAFPQLDMWSPFVYGIPCVPTSLADENGNVVTMSSVRTFKDLERFMRVACIEMGSTAALATAPMTGKDVRRTCVLNSVSLAWRVGRAVVGARAAKADVAAAVLSVCPGKLLFSGKIVEVRRFTTAGFARGEVHIAGSEDGGFSVSDRMVVHIQNENILASLNGAAVCTAPDLIVIMDSDSGSSLATEEVRYGLRVKVLGMLCSPVWQTNEALQVVGPPAFGHPDEVYRPIAEGKFVCRSVIEEYGK